MAETARLEFYAVTWSLVAISAIFLASRTLVKATAHRRLWWDDFFLSFSWIFLAISAGLVTCAEETRLDHEANKTPNQSRITINLLTTLASLFSSLSVAWSKTSPALFTIRISHGAAKLFTWLIIVTVNLVLAIYGFVGFMRCNSSGQAWESQNPGSCWSHEAIITFSKFVAAMDLCLVLLPLTIVLSLQLRLMEMIGLAVCVCLGLVSCATAVMRCFAIPMLWAEISTFDVTNNFIWTVVEITTTILAASVLGHWKRCPTGLATGAGDVVVASVDSTAKDKYRYQRSDFDGTFKSKVHAHTTTITARKNWRFSRAFGIDRESGPSTSSDRNHKTKKSQGKNISTNTPDNDGSMSPRSPPFLALPNFNDDGASKHSSMSTLKHILAAAGGGGTSGGGIVQVNTVTINYDNRSVFSDGQSSGSGSCGQLTPTTWHAPTALAPPPAREGSGLKAVLSATTPRSDDNGWHSGHGTCLDYGSDSDDDINGGDSDGDVGKMQMGSGVAPLGPDLEMGPMKPKKKGRRPPPLPLLRLS